MAKYATLKAVITAAIRENGNKEITGNLLQQQLLAMVNSLGAGYQYAGVAVPSTNPGTPDQNVFYLASQSGAYSNFDGIIVNRGELAILSYSGSWSKVSTGGVTTELLSDIEGGLSNFYREINSLVGSSTYTFGFKFRGGHNYKILLESNVSFPFYINSGETTLISNYTNTELQYNPGQDYDDINVYIGAAGNGASLNIIIEDITVNTLKQDVADLIRRIGKEITGSLSVVSGSAFEQFVDFTIQSGEQFSIKLQSTGGFWPTDVLGNIYAIDEQHNQISIAEYLDYKDYSNIFTASTNIIALLFYRSASATSSGTINYEIETIGQLATKEDVQEVGEKIDAIGKLEQKTFNITTGTNVLCVLPVQIKSNTQFDIFGVVPRGLVSYDAYNVYVYKNAGLTETETVFSGTLYENFVKTFKLAYDIFGVAIQRGVAALQSGQIKLGVNSYIFELKEDAQKGLPVYVDAINGSDSNDGSAAHPFATFNTAISKTGANTTIILVGDARGQNINVLQKSSQESITIIGSGTQKNRIILGTFIESATQYSGNVYYKDLTTFPNVANYHLFQHEIPDVDTLITDAERHPLQRGREYRCESTIIRPNTSIQSVIDSAALTYFWDADNSRLYFKIASGSSLAQNPVVLPSGSAIYGNNGSVRVRVINVDAWYCNFDLSKCHGALIQNCGAKFAYGAAGFQWDNAIGVRLETCEASRTFTGATTGDGFNAHSTEYADPEARHTTCIMINPWSHDNNDDGYSDHERCECAIYGGLFEYNGKAGVTPSYGSHLTCYDVLSRKNYNGFWYVGAISNTEGGKYGQMICYNCVARDNTQSLGFGVDGAGNSMKLISCKSINNPTGFVLGTNTRGELIDCGSVDDTTIKSVGSGATIVIKNTNLVTE